VHASNERRIKRWEHDDVVEAAQTRLGSEPRKPWRVRAKPFEIRWHTLKMRMGRTHFLMKDVRRWRRAGVPRARLQPHARENIFRYQHLISRAIRVRRVSVVRAVVTVQVAQRGPEVSPWDLTQSRYSKNLTQTVVSTRIVPVACSFWDGKTFSHGMGHFRCSKPALPPILSGPCAHLAAAMQAAKRFAG